MAGAAGLLSGIRVLDLTNVLAGPFCGYQLALQGAEVIKVELPGSGDLARQLGASPALSEQLLGASFLAQNAGKKSITVDLKTEGGREVLRRLIRTADVLLENFRPGVMDRLGVGYEALRAVRPDLIYCAISGFGQDGPLRDNPAYDQIIQGLSGIMGLTGNAQDGPYRVGCPICDTLGGLTAAFAVCAALRHRTISGEGKFLDVSMLDATLVSLGWPVSNWLIAQVKPQRLGNDNATASPSGTFRTGNGLLNIAANKQEQFEALCAVLGIPEVAKDERFKEREGRKRERAALTVILERALATNSAEYWERRLNEMSIPAGRILDLPDVLQHPQVLHRQLAQTVAIDGLGVPIKVLRAGFQVSGQPVGVEQPPPKIGEHTSELLAELGYDAAAVGTLRNSGAI